MYIVQHDHYIPMLAEQSYAKFKKKRLQNHDRVSLPRVNPFLPLIIVSNLGDISALVHFNETAPKPKTIIYEQERKLYKFVKNDGKTFKIILCFLTDNHAQNRARQGRPLN